MRPAQFLRLLQINRVLVRHGLDELVFNIHLFRPLELCQLCRNIIRQQVRAG
jgi:hypothetical protein